MTTLYLVRHGETDWNREGRVQGHADTPLNATGRAQAKAFASRIVDVALEVAFSSDSRRAYETARIILADRRLPIATMQDLRERFLGRWEGRLVTDLPASEPEAWRAWLERPREWAPHGGETEMELERRVAGALENIVETCKGQRVLVVSHGGAIRTALRHLVRHEVHDVANCFAHIVEVDGERRTLIGELGCGIDGV